MIFISTIFVSTIFVSTIFRFEGNSLVYELLSCDRQTGTYKALSIDEEQRSRGESLLKPHNVIPAVDINHFAGDAAAGIGGEEDSGRTDFCNIDVAAERG